ncbi:uncharacterized protein EI97DRAFT_457548 [Westerdykella ornata]|uniref:Uncharacterized protein n=1 Tax=Westerdykella ornata TaxID=318751 RepID=A0A6A6JMU8_WESOR|nr:uncharacterized protein EI97DRAFT_457548 [Westerdykella ornata]KAF2277545.1 hypothetical protein EI97DRAFT_457548 [Westerdykella ornata]
MDDASMAPRGPPHPPRIVQQRIYTAPHPNEPPPAYDPPSYEEATRSSSAPLLVGPNLGYGTYQAYEDLEANSVASSNIEESTRSLPEWVGQALVVIVFLAIIYMFWEFVHDADLDNYP